MKAAGLGGRVNIVIVSDHGMTAVKKGNVVAVTRGGDKAVLPESIGWVVDDGPLLAVYPVGNATDVRMTIIESVLQSFK